MTDPAHPGRMLFVNMPVADLERSEAFFAELGFSYDPAFSDDQPGGVPPVSRWQTCARMPSGPATGPRTWTPTPKHRRTRPHRQPKATPRGYDPGVTDLGALAADDFEPLLHERFTFATDAMTPFEVELISVSETGSSGSSRSH